MATETTHAMRNHELALAIPLLPRGAKVLELGAGDGWQASRLAKHGFTVTAVDIANSTKYFTQYFPVVEYDGNTLPFANDSFDAIYSSNVLEHIANFDGVQAELARVLKPGGIAVHCVPSASWRLWTTIGHPIYAIRWALTGLRSALFRGNKTSTQQTGGQLRGKGVFRLLRLGLLPTRHGEHGNWPSEHYLFSLRAWRRRLEQAGWTINSVRPTGLLYSGNEILGLRLPIRFRTQLAHLFGSSTFIFVLHLSSRSRNGDSSDGVPSH